MTFFRNLFTLLVVLAMIGVGVFFALANSTPIALDALVYQFPERSLALWVLGAFALGGLAGMLTASMALVRLRGSVRSLRKQAVKDRAELDRLRVAGLKDGE